MQIYRQIKKKSIHLQEKSHFLQIMLNLKTFNQICKKNKYRAKDMYLLTIAIFFLNSHLYKKTFYYLVPALKELLINW